ncbi:MAG: cell division protein SepF, partial [Armatimonadetes bacterium]|nr:cell division protein SepF [Armatimonadota bacterium]
DPGHPFREGATVTTTPREDPDEEEPEDTEGGLSKPNRQNATDDPQDQEDEAYAEPDQNPKGSPRENRPPMLRVHTPRPTEISVWVSPRSLNDAQSAADKLKERRPVLINLERTDEETARRIVDFISGVTYALDGYYQRIGTKVFLFTPSNTVISVEDDMDQEQRTLFFDQE